MIFFFKQKTAYEMRISDWSSDVCSSDLQRGHPHHAGLYLPVRRHRGRHQVADPPRDRGRHHFLHGADAGGVRRGRLDLRMGAPDAAAGALRSEEHTSELQSLMRISYAVFCLKKKK